MWRFLNAAGGSVIGVATLLVSVQLLLANDTDVGAVGIVCVPDGGIQPQVQSDRTGRVHMIYFKGDPKQGDVFYVRSDDGGVTFSKPLRVNDQADSAVAIGTIRGPHLALGKGDRVHVAWMGSDKALPKAAGNAIPMLYSRLNDAGDRFEPQRNVIRKYVGLDGGGAVAADAEGNVYVAWHAPERGKEEADRDVWIARSKDQGKTFEAEHAAAPLKAGVCGCCGLSISAGPKGRVFIVYRSASQRVNRDIYLLASDNYGQSFNVINTDPWKIGSCAMSTSHVALSPEGAIAVWETQNQIRVAQLDGNAKMSSNVSEVPGEGGNRKHPAVAVNKRGEFIVAWAEGTGWEKGGRVAWQVFGENGEPEAGKSGQIGGLPAWDIPAVFAADNDTFRVAF